MSDLVQRTSIVGLAVLLGVAGCYTKGRGSLGAACFEDQTCKTPLVCIQGVCIDPTVRPDGGVEPDGGSPPQYYPQNVEKDVDVLFLVDNSNSMEQEQANLVQNFPKLVEALRSVKLGGAGCSVTNRGACRIPNVHIGVVTSDLGAGTYALPSCEVTGGDGGKLQSKARKPGCTPPKDPWISYADGVTNVPSPTTDPVAQVKEAFQCIAELGVGGCGFEQQFEAVKRAVDPSLNVNPGFIRKDAFLAVVLLTDEDDCSAADSKLFDPTQQGLSDPLGPLMSFRCTEFGIQCDKNGRQPGVRNNCVPGFDWLVKVSDYVTFFRGLKPPGRVLLFALAGPVNNNQIEVGMEGTNPMLKASCKSANGSAVPAIRIKSLVQALGGHFNEGVDEGNRAVEVNICSTDFSPALRQIGGYIVATLGGQCLRGPPLTPSGAVACQAGDLLATGVTCAQSCLDKANCVVDEITDSGQPNEKVTNIPQCPAALYNPTIKSCDASCPCWRIIPNAECDPSLHGSPYGLQIMRAGEPAPGTVARVRCATSQYKWGSSELGGLPQCT